MKIPALKFSESLSAQPVELDCDRPQDLMLTMGNELPVVYLVRNNDLKHLRNFKDIIADRGIKNKYKGLASYLLHAKTEQIPLIEVNYSQAGRLESSIRGFLKRAVAANENKVFMIGATQAVFDKLTKRLSETEQTRRPTKHAPTSRPVPAGVDLGDTPSRLLFQLRGRHEVPPDLEKKFVGRSVQAELVRLLIVHAAQVDDSMLILGETGTGKEVVARQIHSISGKSGKFVPVNCGAIPSELLESELFGHIKGVFTGATSDKDGLWESANNGTLFLDEIADLQLQHQVKILRTLQENKIRKIGGKEDISVNARVIAATNRDLFSMVDSEQFREDLYYRLRGFLIRTPALRDNPDDIPLLAQFLWTKITGEERKTLPQEILDELIRYRWPGNVRELKMVLSNLQALFGTENLCARDLKAVFYLEGQSPARREKRVSEKDMDLHRAECLRHLKRVDEVVRATQVGARPVLKKPLTNGVTLASVRTALSYRAHELEMLCNQPLLFHNELTFATVHKLKGKLTYFENLLQQNVKEAQSYWNREVTSEISLVTSTLFKEVAHVLDRA